VRFNLHDLAKRHSLKYNTNEYSAGLKQNKETFLSLKLPSNAVLFNVRGNHSIEAMYYTGLPAYKFIPTPRQIEELKQKGRISAVFQADEPLPGYLENDSNVRIIDKKILMTDLK
jgi:hypothetical protein